MRVPPREIAGIGVSMLRSVREGLSYVWRHRPTLWLLVSMIAPSS